MNTMAKQLDKEQKDLLVRKTLQLKSRDLIYFLRSIVHSSTEAEELFQSGSVRVLESSDKLRDPEKAFSWILSVFRNLALDFLRKTQRSDSGYSELESEMIENIPDTPTERSVESVCDCGTRLLNEIPEQYATLLKNVDIDGNSVKQVAKTLGASPNNVSVRLHRARNSLKRAVQEHCQVETLDQCLECDCST
jgi:RNA polymerase sigma factor (sigma-70 family)